MRIRINNPEKTARLATIITLSVMAVWGVVSVLAEIRPFWVDEWRIIYNLKFKTNSELWGQLDFMQQFPRLYLSLLKSFTATLHYSYFSLRLPSFVIGIATIVAIYKLAAKIYPPTHYNRFIMVVMLISCGTFTEYFVQIKQYTMDLLLCVIAIHQLVYLLDLGKSNKINIPAYTILCISFLIAPFFSYTYAITALPIYAVVLAQNIFLWRSNNDTPAKIKTIRLQWLPLFICTFSITAFYVVDASQLSTDADMHKYWGHLMMKNGFDIAVFFTNIFHMFAQVGSGFIFWWLCGLLGVSGFAYGIYSFGKSMRSGTLDIKVLVLLYSILLPLLAIVLFAIGKLPLGEPRLNAFITPAISVIIIFLLDSLLEMSDASRKVSQVLSIILLAGIAGNIYTTIIASLTDDKYSKRMEIYRATEAALKNANQQNLPLLITPGVAYPYENTLNLPFDNNVPGDWVLMTFPSYRVGESKLVYAIDDIAQLQNYLKQLPTGTTSVMVGDGSNYKVVLVDN